MARRACPTHPRERIKAGPGPPRPGGLPGRVETRQGHVENSGNTLKQGAGTPGTLVAGFPAYSPMGCAYT